MIILISNDDGIHSPGLLALAESMRGLGETWVVAPDREQSAVGHAITLSEPIRLHHGHTTPADHTFAVGGTPADCVKLALTELLPVRPDLVISGINRGENTGISVMYSGTVSAATEGTINGIPSIAISLDSFTSKEFSYAATIARKFAILVLERGLPHDTLLNINVPALPAEQVQGIKVARQGHARFQETFLKRVDPRGRTYYWMDGDKVPLREENTDGTALSAGFVAVTPIKLDLTNHEFLPKLMDWPLKVESAVIA